MSKKLLLADDSVTIQRVIELTFSGEDIQVLAVGDGEAAIARIPVDKPDIVLADIGMPKRSGYEVCAFVKNHPDFKTIPVLLLAGAFEPVDEAKAKEVGCDGVLVKPFEPQHVIARVRELIGGATGSPTQSAVQDIPRPAARLTQPRPVEIPRREDRPQIPDDLMDVEEADLEQPPDSEATSTIVLDDSLDDYFDKLDEAFGAVNAPSAARGAVPAAEARPPRPDRPVLERDLESFDEPILVDDSVTLHIEPQRTLAVDPFAGMAEVEPEEAAAVPTIEDLLARMPIASEPQPVTLEETPAPMTFEDAPAPMIFDPPPAPSKVEGPTPSRVEVPAPVIDLPMPPPAVVPLPIAVAPPPIEPPDVTPTLAPAPPAPSRVEGPAPTFVPAPRRVEGPAPSKVEGPAPSQAPPVPMPPPAAAAASESSSGRSIIADAFSALLAAEQGEPGAVPVVRLGGNGSAPVVTEAMVDDVARRVIEKLALGSSDQMSAVVREIVSDVAERLVREEIERIRSKS